MPLIIVILKLPCQVTNFSRYLDFLSMAINDAYFSIRAYCGEHYHIMIVWHEYAVREQLTPDSGYQYLKYSQKQEFKAKILRTLSGKHDCVVVAGTISHIREVSDKPQCYMANIKSYFEEHQYYKYYRHIFWQKDMAGVSHKNSVRVKNTCYIFSTAECASAKIIGKYNKIIPADECSKFYSDHSHESLWFKPGAGSSIIQYSGFSMAIEICADHNARVLKQQCLIETLPRPDIHLVLSNSTALKEDCAVGEICTIQADAAAATRLLRGPKMKRHYVQVFDYAVCEGRFLRVYNFSRRKILGWHRKT